MRISGVGNCMMGGEAGLPGPGSTLGLTEALTSG